MEIISVKNLSFKYPKSEKETLKDIDFSLSSGDFVVLCGVSGCGKTTLLRHLKSVFTPCGNSEGEVLFKNQPLSEISHRIQSEKIGFVGQNVENQIVTDKVWHELSFGLESLGLKNCEIRSRVAETASFFGIGNWFDKDVAELSGGQKQILNLASVMVMRPELLVLDEPTSQLDPIASEEFLSMVKKVNRDLGTTVIITEHRLEDIISYANRIIVMEKGKIIYDDSPYEVGLKLKDSKNSMFYAMPSPMRIWSAVPDSGENCIFTVSQGRKWLENYVKNHKVKDLPKKEEYIKKGEPTLYIDSAWFRYEKNSVDILKGISLKAYQGELLAVVGGNGAGKSTMISLVTGARHPYRGNIYLNGQKIQKVTNLFQNLLGVLPQNPQTLFTKNTVEEDLKEIFADKKIPTEIQNKKVSEILKLCELEDKRKKHPYDLSGGEQQRAALAKVLLLEPKILLLDEPTKGMDAKFKYKFASVLKKLLNRGVTIVMVSHDIEFCAKYADRCAMLFNGEIISENTAHEFFKNNSFYTTSISRMAKTTISDAVTDDDVIYSLGGEISFEDESKDNNNIQNKKETTTSKKPEEKKKNVFKKIVGIIGTAFLAIALIAGIFKDKISFLGLSGEWISYILIFTALAFLIISLSSKQNKKETKIVPKKNKLPKRTVISLIIVFILIPITVFFGAFYLGDEKYLFTSLLLMFEGMIPFYLVFEGSKPKARELVIIAVLCALGAAGRSVFYMFPHFKPVAALTIIAGVAFGGETGFLVGSLTMLISNIIFQQGPWTLWQMMAMGIIGFVGGLLYYRGFLSKNKISLCVFGFVSTLVIYGGIMNFATAIMAHAKMTLEGVLPFFVSGFPVDIVHALATAMFLLLISEPMSEKLDRVKTKYGLLE